MEKELTVEIFLHEEALLGALARDGETQEQVASRLLRNELQRIARTFPLDEQSVGCVQ